MESSDELVDIELLRLDKDEALADELLSLDIAAELLLEAVWLDEALLDDVFLSPPPPQAARLMPPAINKTCNNVFIYISL